MPTKVILKTSDDPDKKYMVTFERETGRSKTIHFGQRGADDYTKTKDSAQRKRYLDRHKKEDWSSKNVESAAWWSRWFLWEKPSKTEAKTLVKSKLPAGYVMS